MTIGRQIKQCRKKKKITQQELAEKIGRTESSVRKYEADLVAIPLNVLEQIASILDVPTSYLLGYEVVTKIQEINLASVSTDCLLAELKRRCENGG